MPKFGNDQGNVSKIQKLMHNNYNFKASNLLIEFLNQVTDLIDWQTCCILLFWFHSV